jgi:hypothetical protein
MDYHLTILLSLAASPSPRATVLNYAKMIAPRQMNSVVSVHQQRVGAIVGMTSAASSGTGK